MEPSFCLTALEPPVQTVVFHRGGASGDKDVYLFVGATAPETLSAITFTPDEAKARKSEWKALWPGDYKTRLALDLKPSRIHIVRKRLLPDDTITVSKWQLLDVLPTESKVHHIDHLYMWGERPIYTDADFLQFIAHIPKFPVNAESFLEYASINFSKPLDQWTSTSKTRFDRNDALAYLKKQEWERHMRHEAMEFSYKDSLLNHTFMEAHPFSSTRFALDPHFITPEGKPLMLFQTDYHSQQCVGSYWSRIHVTSAKEVQAWAASHTKDPSHAFHGYSQRYFPRLSFKDVTTPSPTPAAKQQAAKLHQTILHMQEQTTPVYDHPHSHDYSKAIKSVSTRIQRMHIRIHPRVAKLPLDMGVLFRNLHTTPTVPLIEWRDLQNNTYKVHTPSMRPEAVPLDTWTTWTQYNDTYQRKGMPRIQRAAQSIRAKMLYQKPGEDPVFITFVLYDNGAYDIKYRVYQHQTVGISELHASLAIVNGFLDSLQSVMDFQPHVFYRIHEVWEPTGKTPFFMELLEWDVAFDYEWSQPVKAFKSVAQWLENQYAFVNLAKENVQDKNMTLSMEYKRVSDFINMDAMEAFIQKHYAVPAADLIKMIQKQFSFSEEEAQRAYKEKSEKMMLDVYKRAPTAFYKPKFQQGLWVQMQYVNPFHVRAHVRNVKDAMSIQGLCHFIQYALSTADALAAKGQKLTKAEKQRLEAIEKEALVKEGELTLHWAEEAKKDLQKEEDASKTDAIDDGGDDNQSDAESVLSSFTDVGDIDDLLALDDPEEQKREEAEAKSASKKPSSIVVTDEAPIKGNKSQKEEEDDVDDELNEDWSDVDTNALKRKKYHRLILKRLVQYDKSLFKHKGPGQYSTICGKVDMRQPIVLNEQEKAHIDEHYSGSYTGYVQTGSTEDKKKKYYYVCPRIWCPLSKVTLTSEQLEAYHNRCPGPIAEHPIIMDAKYWAPKKGQEGTVRPRYPKLLKPTLHEKGLQMPCCFKLDAAKGKGKGKEDPEESDPMSQPSPTPAPTTTTVTDPEETTKERYVNKIKGMPMDPGRYGTLPEPLAAYFGCEDCYGVLQDKQVCYVRKGVRQGPNSLMHALMSALDVGDDRLTDLESWLTPGAFLCLNNGNAAKTFFHEDESPFDPENWSRFRAWFLDQKEYIKQFQLQAVADEVATRDPQDAPGAALREYMVYNAYTNFMYYIHSDIPKHHDDVMDLFVRGSPLNPYGYNLMLVEYRDNQAFLQCPLYGGSFGMYDFSKPFVVILKQGKYYEPIVRISTKKGPLKEMSAFPYAKNSYIKQMVHYAKHGCQHPSMDAVKQALKLTAFLKTEGHQLTQYVIHSGFKICGVITSKDVYVPLGKPCPMLWNAPFAMRYRYVDSLLDLRPQASSQEVRALMGSIQSYMRDDGFEVSNVLEEANEDDDPMAIELANGSIVPLRKIPKKPFRQLLQTELNNMDVVLYALEHHRSGGDANADEIQLYYNTLQTILRPLLKKLKYKQQLHFIQHPKNPLPLFMRKKQAKALVQTLMEKEGVNAEDEYVDMLTEDVLRKDPLYLYATTLEHIQYNKHERVMDQYDIYIRRLHLLHESLQNPFKGVDMSSENWVDYIPMMLSDVPDHIPDENDDDPRAGQHVVRFDISGESEGIKPARWENIMPGFMVQVPTAAEKKNGFWLSFLQYVAELRNQPLTAEQIHAYTLKRMRQDYEADAVRMIQECLTNASFLKMVPGNLEKIYSMTWEEVNSYLSKPAYVCSEYEWRLWAELLGCNVIFIGRQHPTKLPNGMRCYYQHSDMYVVLHIDHQKEKDLIRIIHKQGELVHTMNSFTPELGNKIQAMCKGLRTSRA